MTIHPRHVEVGEKDGEALGRQEVQSGGATIQIEFNACDAVEADRKNVNASEPFLPDWVEDVNACDGYKNIRWRMRLVSNLISQQVARVYSVNIPLVYKE